MDEHEIGSRPRGRPKDEQLTARRSEEILDAAARIFAERGFANTDVQVVADELQVGKGTIYRYFPTKRDLFLAAVDRGMRRLREQVDACLRLSDPMEQVTAGIQAYLQFFTAHPEYVELFIQERAEFKDRDTPTYFKHRDANSSHWEQVVRGLMSQGVFRQIPVQRSMNVVGDLLYGTMFTNYFAKRKSSYEEQAADILDVILNGLLSDELRAARRPTGADGPPSAQPDRRAADERGAAGRS